MKYKWVLAVLLPLVAVGAVPNRYIVELSSEPVAEHVMRQRRATGRKFGIDSAMAHQKRAEIRTEQGKIRRDIENAGGKVLDAVDTVANAFIVSIPDDRADRLASIPGVKRVHRVQEYKMLLDHAIPLHKVPQAWNRIGIDKAGLGVKIGIVDSGIDISHPGLQDTSLPAVAGFPKTTVDSDVAHTNNKVIVARSYVRFLDPLPDDQSAQDDDGHGTSTAMGAAGVTNNGPLGPITGVAPKAYVGNYKVIGSEGTTRSDIIIKAIEDAVTDGMDVINLSLGTRIAAPRLEDDFEVQALERAAGLGVIVVASAGNGGPDPNTIGSPGTGPTTITVGASVNDRVLFAGSATIQGVPPYEAIPGSGANSKDPITGSLFDVETLDQDGLACLPFPLESLKERIAFVLRGTCNFEDKLNNVQRAGAVAALIYTDKSRPVVAGMNVGAATLPSEMVSYADGVDIKKRLAGQPALPITLRFGVVPIAVNADALAEFSGAGPNVDESIKPDLVAAGTWMYTATEKSVESGAGFSPSGYTIEFGTSFSAPLVAGAAALLKGARPGLTAAQYRSLLINTATPMTARVQQAGAGSLNMDAALQATATFAPTSINFRSGGADPKLSRTLIISNVGASAETYSLTVVPRDPGAAPLLATSSVSVDPGKSAQVAVDFSGTSLKAGQYEGFVKVQGSSSALSRVPYWYAVASDAPARVTVLYLASDFDDYNAGARISDAIDFRVTDGSGLVLANVVPKVTVSSGNGAVLSTTSLDRRTPGVFSVSVRLGTRKGDNIFQIAVGDLKPVEVNIPGN